jgi:hemoglobin
MAESIYDRYGGFPAVSMVVSRFYARILASPTLAHYFAGTNMEGLIDHQVKFMCKVLGGPDNYDGRSLRAVHHHLRITPEAFQEVAGHLQATLEESGFAPADVTTVLSVVSSTRGDVVAA